MRSAVIMFSNLSNILKAFNTYWPRPSQPPLNYLKCVSQNFDAPNAYQIFVLMNWYEEVATKPSPAKKTKNQQKTTHFTENKLCYDL